jgi:hypothetical protein
MGYFIAFIIGGIFGVITMCLAVVAKDGDK